LPFYIFGFKFLIIFIIIRSIYKIYKVFILLMAKIIIAINEDGETLYKKIVIPTDGSDVSFEAAKHAVNIAKKFDAELYAIYVVDVSPFVGLPAEGSWELISELLKEEGNEALKKVKKLAEENEVNIHTEILEGVPAKEIVEFAEKKKADLIVMGTTGKTGLERILLGSVAERVIKNAHCPVLVVKKSKKE